MNSCNSCYMWKYVCKTNNTFETRNILLPTSNSFYLIISHIYLRVHSTIVLANKILIILVWSLPSKIQPPYMKYKYCNWFNNVKFVLVLQKDWHCLLMYLPHLRVCTFSHDTTWEFFIIKSVVCGYKF